MIHDTYFSIQATRVEMQQKYAGQTSISSEVDLQLAQSTLHCLLDGLYPMLSLRWLHDMDRMFFLVTYIM